MARDLVSKLTDDQKLLERFRLKSISPDTGKYGKDSEALVPFLSAEAEWKMFASVQRALLQTRVKFGQAEPRHLAEMDSAIEQFDPLNAALLEGHKDIRHDQLAVLEELGNHMSEETKSLLHPGTTSYDIVDTARAYLFREAWKTVMRPKVVDVTNKLCVVAQENKNIAQAGRTHLQITSPVLLGGLLAGYAARLAERTEKCDFAFSDLRGKVSGIVGTGAGIDMVIGEGKSLEFEKAVLDIFGLKPDYTATQIVQKERLADVGHSVVTLMSVLGDFANDMRILYSSDINEITSRDASKRLGGSSADASKNNPINYENIAGKVSVVESGMGVLYDLIRTDLQRDLRSSVLARYQPHPMLAQTFESFCRASKELDQLSVNKDKVAANLDKVRKFPSEAATSILRGSKYVHPTLGVGHDAVKNWSRVAKEKGVTLMEIAMADEHFAEHFEKLGELQKRILNGEIEKYIGSAHGRADHNIAYAREVAGRK